MLRMNGSMSSGDCVMDISAHNTISLDERKLWRMFVPEERWEAGPEKAIAASILTALHSPVLRTAVLDRVEYKRAGKNLDQVIAIKNPLKVDRHLIQNYEVGRKEAGHKEKKYTPRRQIVKHKGPCCGCCLEKNHEGTYSWVMPLRRFA